MASVNLDDFDMTKLSDNEKKDLQQFLANETQKINLQTKIHTLTDKCFRKCITGTIRSNTLDNSERTCLANCTERFFDVAWLSITSMQSKGGN
ncbi:Tim10/DDP family zinc finger-domain-containing protein, partial [Annulohypoxylon truncatum]|uniref:Tim10/DDP family zinc finger-domain-containing protein n=1 Tax=Annulohypoxylon truncatum TaxID=327061 RepID=UPI0020079952